MRPLALLAGMALALALASAARADDPLRTGVEDPGAPRFTAWPSETAAGGDLFPGPADPDGPREGVLDGSGARAVPEASTWAMMGLGFAALGYAGFRARKARPDRYVL